MSKENKVKGATSEPAQTDNRGRLDIVFYFQIVRILKITSLTGSHYRYPELLVFSRGVASEQLLVHHTHGLSQYQYSRALQDMMGHKTKRITKTYNQTCTGIFWETRERNSTTT